MLELVKRIDEKTGEVINERQRHIEETLNEEGYKVPTHKLGAKIFADVTFPAEMTDSEIGKMARLAKLMIAEANMLGYRTGRGILPYTEKHIIELIGLSQKRGREFIEKMKRLGVIQWTQRKYGEVERTEYYINPAYFFAGRRININLYLLFREHLDQILPAWVLKEFMSAAKEKEV